MRISRRIAAVLTIAASALVVASFRSPVSATGAPVCLGAPIPKSTGGYWVCTFDDEFYGNKLDTSKWAPVTSIQSGVSSGGGCYENSPSNIAVSGGTLKLTARKGALVTCANVAGVFRTPYTLGQVSTANKFSQTDGLFAIRARFPAAKIAGLESALWLWRQDAAGPSGEIDIAEEYSQYPGQVIPYVHYPYDPNSVNTLTNTNVVSSFNCKVSNVNAFHIYALEWTPTSMTFMVDAKTCFVDDYVPSGSTPFTQPYFIALTQALGIGTNAFIPGRTPLPATTQIDWVRVWK